MCIYVYIYIANANIYVYVYENMRNRHYRIADTQFKAHLSICNANLFYVSELSKNAHLRRNAEKCDYDLKVLWFNINQNKNIQNALKEQINV